MGWHEDGRFTPGKRLDEPEIEFVDVVPTEKPTEEPLDEAVEDDHESVADLLRKDGRAAAAALGFAGLASVSIGAVYYLHKHKKGNQ